MIGKTISHYKIIEKLGGGGMGVVYKAQDLKLDRYVALKFLPSMFSSDEEAKKRFVIEAQAASSLQHHCICNIHDIEETEDNQIFICMDFYDGETLKEKIERGPIKLDEAVDITIQIAKGLHKAHEQGIIHRDIKPANIFINKEGEVKILDFGLAKLPEKNVMTSAGTTLGTVAYMSPEQTCGEELDKRSDIWSLGVVIYEMLTGQRPFRGEYEQSTIYLILSEDPEPIQKFLPDLPEKYIILLNRSLQKNPKNRYQDVSEMVDDLMGLKKHRTNKLALAFIKTHKLFIVIFIAALVLLLYSTGLFSSYFNNNKKFTNEVVVKISGAEKWNYNRISPSAVEYLIIDDLLQSSNLISMDDSQYRNIYLGENSYPYFRLDGKLMKTNVGFELGLVFKKNNESLKDTTISFNEPVTLLNRDLHPIVNEVYKFIGINQCKRSLFTKDWDAFVNFYKGEMAWNHLDKNLASHYFGNALNIDSGFALAKLRLADVYYFEENKNKSKRMLKEIIPQLTFLSQVDSLKAEALTQKINGNQRKVININSMIVEMLPGRKEALYDLAEAYFSVGDIENAIEQYNKALKLDKNYTLALNHRGYCYSHLGDHQKALQDFRRYVELDSSANSFDSWGDGLMAAGKLDSAEKIKEVAIHKSPKTEYFYSSLAYVQINQGEYEEALLNINKYIELSSTDEQLSIGYFLKALNYYFQKNIDSSYYYSKLSIRTYDASELSSRNHQAHWLIGLVSYNVKDFKQIRNEIKLMNDLINRYRINNTNYHKILKFKLSLDFLLALSTNDMEKVDSVFNEFDFSIKYKVKDWSSPFDLAFFNTLFGNFLNQKGKHLLAEERYNKALDYNPNYSYAIYGLLKVSRDLNKSREINKYKSTFNKLWKKSDLIARRIYN
jgi:serine/threonine protein kinase